MCRGAGGRGGGGERERWCAEVVWRGGVARCVGEMWRRVWSRAKACGVRADASALVLPHFPSHTTALSLSLSLSHTRTRTRTHTRTHTHTHTHTLRALSLSLDEQPRSVLRREESPQRARRRTNAQPIVLSHAKRRAFDPLARIVPAAVVLLVESRRRLRVREARSWGWLWGARIGYVGRVGRVGCVCVGVTPGRAVRVREVKGARVVSSEVDPLLPLRVEIHVAAAGTGKRRIITPLPRW